MSQKHDALDPIVLYQNKKGSYQADAAFTAGHAAHAEWLRPCSSVSCNPKGCRDDIGFRYATEYLSSMDQSRPQGGFLAFAAFGASSGLPKEIVLHGLCIQRCTFLHTTS